MNYKLDVPVRYKIKITKLISEFTLKALVFFVYIVQIQMTLPKNIVRYIINLRHLIIFAY